MIMDELNKHSKPQTPSQLQNCHKGVLINTVGLDHQSQGQGLAAMLMFVSLLLYILYIGSVFLTYLLQVVRSGI